MEILIVKKKHNGVARYSVGAIGLFFSIALVASLCGSAFYVGSEVAKGRSIAVFSERVQHRDSVWQREIDKQSTIIEKAKADAEGSLDALAIRLSTLHAHLFRLNALGARLTDMAKIQDIDFDSLDTSGMGGPLISGQEQSIGIADFIQKLEQMNEQIRDRGEKLMAIEAILIDDAIQAQALPDGVPLPEGGWISSLFGWRTDPITGKQAFHAGMDISGRANSKISTVAAGIVTWAGKRFGYGNMVEVNHGNGYTTRYAHHKRNLVAVGDKVEKGENIAIIGSTGRSTGTHLHFEVLHNNQPVNPKKFLRATN